MLSWYRIGFSGRLGRCVDDFEIGLCLVICGGIIIFILFGNKSFLVLNIM